MLVKVGNKEYKSKKEAIAHYRGILNSYDFGQSLNDADFSDLMDLLNFRYPESELPAEPPETTESPENINYVSDIKVSRVQFNTKCFEALCEDGRSYYISYLQILNNSYYSKADLFIAACRSAVNSDMHRLKSYYFKGAVNRMAKCQETGVLSKWEELVVDHRQPNTFSVIVDRFKELNSVDLEAIEYTSDSKNNIVFVDAALSEKFRKYHSERANLRIVRRECNSSRSGLARVKRSSKDKYIEY
jgi:hypothetical protein